MNRHIRNDVIASLLDDLKHYMQNQEGTNIFPVHAVPYGQVDKVKNVIFLRR